MRSDVLELLREAGGCISGEKIAERLGVTRAAVWKKIAALRYCKRTAQRVRPALCSGSADRGGDREGSGNGTRREKDHLL